MRLNTKCSVAIHMLLFIGRYGETKKVTSEVLASSTGCNPVIIRNLLVRLKKAGMITVPRGTGGARLAKSTAEMTFYDVQQAVDPRALEDFISVHPEPNSGCPIGKNIVKILAGPSKRLENAIIKEMSGIRLSDLERDLEAENGAECTCFDKLKERKGIRQEK